MRVELDDKLISPVNGVVVRKAPGHDSFDFGQVIMLLHDKAGSREQQPQPPRSARSSLVRYVGLQQDFLAPVLPSGLIWHFRFLSSWGDAYYIGLDALQLFDDSGLPPSQAQLHAVPPDVNVLPNVQVDALIVLMPHTLTTSPHSTSIAHLVLPILVDSVYQGDPRTVSKLLLPPYTGGSPPPPPPPPIKSPADVWLAPWSPDSVNDLWVTFDTPVR